MSENEAKTKYVKKCPLCGRVYSLEYNVCIVCGELLRTEKITPET